MLLVGSDAGPDRKGTRTDTMMLASIDTTTGRTTLFALPRNIGYAQFPPGTPMAEKFPKGFHDAATRCRATTCSTPCTPGGSTTPRTRRPRPPRIPG